MKAYEEAYPNCVVRNLSAAFDYAINICKLDIEKLSKRYMNTILDTKLKMHRMYAEMSQSELAKKSGVSLRAIQLYEQRVNDLNKAQVHTVYKLARALYCCIKDLLEDPQTIYK